MRLARRLVAVVAFVGLLIAGWQFAASNSQPVVVHHAAGEFAAFALWTVLLVAFGSSAAAPFIYPLF